MGSINDGYMLLIMKILGLYRVRRKKRTTLAAIYFALCFCLSLIFAYHGWIWSINLNDYSFQLRNLFALVHMSIFFINPLANLIQFGLINKFDFTLWHKSMIKKLLKMRIHVHCETFWERMFSYLCIILTILINEVILYFLNIRRIYDYFPIVFVELWALVPVLEYIRIVLAILKLHETVLRRILLTERISLAYGSRKRHCPVYFREYSSTKGKTLKKLKKIHKIILNVCYDVIPYEYGFSIMFLIVSYVLSFLHDVVTFLPVMSEIKIAASFTSRTIFKFIFLIIFFTIGETSTKKIRNGIKDIHKAIIVETTFPIDYQLKNVSLIYLPRDLTFRAGSLMRISCEHYLSALGSNESQTLLIFYLLQQRGLVCKVHTYYLDCCYFRKNCICSSTTSIIEIISILTGYVILQIQAQLVWHYDLK